jgi:hypothetical protein
MDWKFQIQDRKELGPNLNSVVWVRLEFAVGNKGCVQFQFLFGCANHGIDNLLSLDNINLYTCNKNSMCILECINIMLW